MITLNSIRTPLEETDYQSTMTFVFSEDTDCFAYVSAFVEVLVNETFGRATICRALLDVADELKKSIEIEYKYLPKELE